MSQLFEELVEKTLLRLPVKSLLRFRCVSKSWRALIDSKYFINSHLRQSFNTNTNLHLILSGLGADITSVSLDNQVSDFIFPCSRLNPPFQYVEGNIMSSCNGLLFIQNPLREWDVAVWNPFSRRYRKLPELIEHVPPTGRNPLSYRLPNFGFGYNYSEEDYTVVRIKQDIDFDLEYIQSEVKVYSLRLNSWRAVEDFPYSRYLFDGTAHGCFVNGAIHWIVYPMVTWMGEGSDQLPWLVATYNLQTEKFGTLRLPINEDVCRPILGVLKRCLCLCVVYESFAELWVMQSYGVTESWNKMHSLSNYNVVKSLACSKNSEKLLVLKGFNSLSWCNSELKENAEIIMMNMPNCFDTCICLESLISLGDDSKFDGIN